METETESTVVKRRAVMSRALLRSAERLGLGPAGLASATGLRKAEIASLASEGGELDPADPRWDRFVELVRLCWVLDTLAGGDADTMRAWMTTYEPDLGAVPAALVAADDGLHATIRYLEAHGVARH